jgi:hypothetical protein
MAPESAKPPKEEGVLASLPSTRPTRLSRRGQDGVRANGKTTAKPKADAQRKPRAKPAAKAAGKPAAKAAAAKPAAAKPRPVAVEPEVAPRPKPVRAAAPQLKEPIAKATEHRPEDEHTSGTDIAKTVVQAAGELAQLGLTVGGQMLKRFVDRLPRG